MRVITLTSDRKPTDFFLARVKGQLLRDCSGVVIVDIAHGLDAFNVTQAGFAVRHSFRHFPERSIHIIGVDSEDYDRHRHIVFEYENHIFITADSGIVSLIVDSFPSKIIRISNSGAGYMPAMLRFAELVRKLIEKDNILLLGEETKEVNTKILSEPVVESSMILGQVVYIDSYKNVITNITKTMIDAVGRGRSLEIAIGSNRNIIRSISKKYSDVEPGELTALFNSLGFLEIAIVRGPVAEILNFNLQTQVRIRFAE